MSKKHPPSKDKMPKGKMDTTILYAITPTIATMLTGYITVSDGFLKPLAVAMETMPPSMAWLDFGMNISLYMA